MQRSVVPNLNDWTQTGKVLTRLAAKYDYEKIGQGRLTNDALIAMSAARLGITVITANARDYMRLAGFHPFQWKVHEFRSSYYNAIHTVRCRGEREFDILKVSEFV